MKSYSDDLRIRIFNYSLIHAIRETARIFDVSPNTVYLLKKLFIETGSLKPHDYPSERSHLITSEGESYLKSLLVEENDLTLEELRHRYEKVYGVQVSTGTMFNTLEKLNITYKKKSFSDPKKYINYSDAKKNYYEQLDKVESEKIFYLDETSSCLNMSPSYGRSERNSPAYDEKPTYPAETVSSIALLSINGITAKYTYSGSLNAKVFIAYLNAFVLPILTEEQTLVMDNHPVHRAIIVQNYFKEHNINVIYLPPYSPEFNPIEEVFSKVKNYINRQKARTLDALLTAIDNSFNSISSDDIYGYFIHSAQW